MDIIKVYKINRKIVCYITGTRGKEYPYAVHTGKPSDATCIGWSYKSLSEAEATAKKFQVGYMNLIKAV